MDNGGPNDVRESYFKEAVDEMMRARTLEWCEAVTDEEYDKLS